MVRIKHRYLLVNILYPSTDTSNSSVTSIAGKDLPWTIQFRQPTNDKFNSKALATLVRRAIEDAFGDYGSGMAAGTLIVKYFSAATSTAIIRVARAHYRLVWAALSYINKLPTGQPCVFQVVRVSGTIKKSEEAAIRLARAAILKAQGGAILSGDQSRADTTMADVSAGVEDDDDDEMDEG